MERNLLEREIQSLKVLNPVKKAVELIPEFEALINEYPGFSTVRPKTALLNYEKPSVTMGTGTVTPLPSASGSTVTPTPCITTFANQLPKHLEPKLIACINKIVPSINTLLLFEQTLKANQGSIWVRKLSGDLKTFLTFTYPNVNLTIELWRFVTIPIINKKLLLRPLSKYLKAKSSDKFTVSIIGTLDSQSIIENISSTSLTNFVSSAGSISSINH